MLRAISDHDTERRPFRGCLGIGCGGAVAWYPAAYIYARLTHMLVWYGSFVAAPDAMSRLGIGFHPIELFFLPLTMLETLVR